jgi:carbonic anhydrase
MRCLDQSWLTVLAIFRLERGLKAVPSGTTVRVDMDLDIMDSTGWKALEQWCSAHIRSGGSVRLDALHEAWNPNPAAEEDSASSST